MPLPHREPLRAHLIASGISGDTATPRSNAVRHAEALAADDADKHLGIGRRGRDAKGVLGAVAELCGCSDDLTDKDGPGVIDPERTIAGLEAMASRLKVAGTRGERVLFATGHPSALTPWYARMADAVERAGARIIEPLEDERLDAPEGSRHSRGPRLIRYFDRVGVLCVGWALVHTHESWPMQAMLDAETPDLVVSDHGFAGAAAARGIQTIAITDVNDPAIAVGWQDGMFEAVVPLDDNLSPRVYQPLADAVVAALTT